VRRPTLRLRRSPTCEASDRFSSDARHPVGDHRSPVVRFGLWRFRVTRCRHRHDDLRRDLDDPRNIYVNETIGFSFAFDENWRRLGTDTDGRIQLVHEYFVPGDPFVVVSWEPTMGRTLDMFADELAASSGPDVITAWDWATGELGGFDWESADGSVPQRNVRAVHPDPYSGQAILIESIGSCTALCQEAGGDPQWTEVVGMIRDTWTWLEPAEREVADCGVLGGGRYRVRFAAGAFGTRIECALVRGETYLFRVGVAEDQTESVVSGTDAGNYEIVVGSIRGNAPFALEIDVR